MPTTNKVFLSLDVDLDGIPQSQTAVDASAVVTEVSAAPAGVSYVTCGTGSNIAVGDLPISDLGAGNITLGSNDILARKITAANNLSGGPDCNTEFDGPVSAISGLTVSGNDTTPINFSGVSAVFVSGCPYPPPFCYIAAGGDLGGGVADFYFGSGVSLVETKGVVPGLDFDATNGYWTVAEAGYYEFVGFISQNVSTSPVTVTNYVITTTGYGGTEAVKSASYSVLRANSDPHDTVAHWMGYLAAGVKVAIKCTASAGTMFSERGSTASAKRIG